MTTDDSEFDDDGCWNCDGDGFVTGCSWNWQCDTWDGDSCLCTRRCHVCNPVKPDAALQAVLATALAKDRLSEIRQNERDRAAIPAGEVK